MAGFKGVSGERRAVLRGGENGCCSPAIIVEIATHSDLPETCHPVDCQEALLGYKLQTTGPFLYQVPQADPPSTNPQSFQEFLTQQTQWKQKLLVNLELQVPFSEIATHLPGLPHGTCSQ